MSLLNILGLSIGLGCAIFITTWVFHESNYDSFVPNKDQIYRVSLEGKINNEYLKSSLAFAGIGPESSDLFSEVEAFVRLSPGFTNTLLQSENGNYIRANGFAADSNFFDLFQYKFISGERDRTLDAKNSIVIDQQIAEVIFGDNPALGETISIGQQAFAVTGVIENVPSNSHLQFQFIVPTSSLSQSWHENQWAGDNTFVYLKLIPFTDISALGKRITDLLFERNQMIKEIGVKLFLQPISDIPFATDFKFDTSKKTNKNTLITLSAIAFLTLFIACINFTNLFISSTLKRRKAIGVKISSGASKYTILKEYLIEVSIYVIIALFMAIILLEIAFPFLSSLSKSTLTLDYLNTKFIVTLIPVVLLTIIISGFFPGIYLSKFRPNEIFKVSGGMSGKNSKLQKFLVSTQFLIASALIFAVLVFTKQINFLHSKDLGFDKDNLLYTYTTGNLQQTRYQQRLKNELSNDPDITAIGYRGALPTIWNNGNSISSEPSQSNLISAEWIFVDQDYFTVMSPKFIEGNNIFSTTHDSLNYCIVNEKTVELLGLRPPYLDQIIYSSTMNNQAYQIKGVIENLNEKSLHQAVDPCMYALPRWTSDSGIMLFRLADVPKGIEAIKAYYEKEFPNQPFEYWFLDETYDNLYKSETKARQILFWFTGIALSLTSLGLLAIAYYTTERRTKEIGIRKVIGAKSIQIIYLLNKEFLKWVLFAFIIACLLGYYLMQSWLANFAYKTSIDWWLFGVVGLCIFTISALTISFLSWKAARRNPVEALRYE